MTRKESIKKILEKNPNGLQLKDIIHRLYGKGKYDSKSAWSNYMGTYHCLKNHRDMFSNPEKGIYKYDPQNTKPDYEDTPIRELIEEAFISLKKSQLRCNEVTNYLLKKGKAVGYKSIYAALSTDFVKKGVFYEMP